MSSQLFPSQCIAFVTSDCWARPIPSDDQVPPEKPDSCPRLLSPCSFCFGLTPLLSALELVDLGLQTLQFQPFGIGRVTSLLFAGAPLGLEPLTLLGLASLDLQPVRLDAFLTPAL